MRIYRTIGFIGSLIIFLFINSCDKENIIRNEDNYVLSGTVLINTQPADNYIVSIVSRPDITVNTNSDGKFTINDLEVGTYKLKIEKQYSDNTIITRYENIYVDRDTTYQPFTYKRLNLQYELGINPQELKIYWSGIEDKYYEYLLYEVTDNNIDSLIYTASDILDSTYTINDFKYWKDHCFKIISQDTIGNYQDNIIQYNNLETSNISGVVKGDGYLVPNDPNDNTLLILYKDGAIYDSTRSNSNGEFSFSNVVTGQYTLKAEREFPFDNFAYGNNEIEINSDNNEYIEVLLDSIKHDYFPIKPGMRIEYFYKYRQGTPSCESYTRFIDRTIIFNNTVEKEDTIYFYFDKIDSGIYVEQLEFCGEENDTTIIYNNIQFCYKQINGQIFGGYNPIILGGSDDTMQGYHIYPSTQDIQNIAVMINDIEYNAIKISWNWGRGYLIFAEDIGLVYAYYNNNSNHYPCIETLQIKENLTIVWR